jgi:hypothetical protein
VLSAKLFRQARFPRILEITHFHLRLSLLFRQLRSEGTQPLQMARELRSRNETTKSPRTPQSPQSPQSLKRKRKGKATAETKSVDINDEDYNIRSPESTQLVIQTEGTTKSPKRQRKDKAAAAPKPTDEDYNIRSPERTELLTQIKRILNDAPVTPAFWACCQLADMNRLQKLATYDRTAIIFFLKSPITLLSQCELLGL